MNKTFTKRKLTAVAAAALAAFCALPAAAQLNYRPTSSVNTTGTYTDLGTNGTAITVANTDDALSAAQNIGFTFNYNGQAFTQFILSTNGFIKLGSTAPSAATLLNAIGSATAADVNIIAPSSNVDLLGATNQTATPTEYRVATTGTAPNRVTTIQWENVADKATPASSATAQFTTMQFQVKLYETTNVVEFVYGTWVSNSATTPSGQPFLVGLKGSSNGIIDRLLASKTSSATAWTTTTFTPGDPASPNTLPAHFVRNTFLPDPGRTYRFTPVVIPANDMAVMALFTQGKMAKSSGTPQAIQAIVKNNGTAAITNRAITLSISGSNSFTNTVTLGSLAPGEDSLITFAPFNPANISTNNFVEVSVPSDGDNTNNVKEANIVVTANTEGYAQYPTTAGAEPVIVSALRGYFPTSGTTTATNSGMFLSRFFATNKVRVSTVRAYVPGAAFNPAVNTTGRTLYAVVLDETGVEIGRSANKVITAAEVDKLVSFPITSPLPILENENYFVGLVMPANAAATSYTYPMGVQTEEAAREDAYFAAAIPTAGPATVLDVAGTSRHVIEAELINIMGSKEELNANLVSVYPNPSNGIFTISAKDMKGTNVAFEVRDLQGKLVYNASAAKDNATLNLKNLASGVYMLKVSTDAQVAVKRLVIE
jgi:hypothetical protein